jgi:MFS transporter, SP family, general alpha glucoside:H+ symporter
MVFVGQVLSGNLFVLNYQNYFYELAGLDNSAMLAFINYCVAVVGNITSYFVVDTIGRRPLYVYGALGLAVANLLVGFMSLLQGSNPVAAGNVAVFGLSLWSFIYQCCVGTTAFAINGETPSNRLRAKTNAWVNLVNALVSFAISYAIPPLFQPDAANLGLKMGYLFGGCAVVLFAITFFTLPETAGRTSWELDRLFEAKVSARKFKQARFDSDGVLIPSSVGKACTTTTSA